MKVLSVVLGRRGTKVMTRSALVLTFAGLGALVWAAARPTTTFTVNTTVDSQNGNCDTDCTLRDAIALAQNVNGTVAFAIGSGHQTITLDPILGGLGTSMPLSIDATTQPGYAGSPLVEINCGGKSVDALVIEGGFTTVKGLVITNGCQTGIRIDTAGGNTIQGNFIGTDWTGASDGNVYEGINVLFRNNQIGGTTAAARNVVVGGTNGVAIALQSDGNQVQGNYINTNAAGTGLLGHATEGIGVTGANNTIGGLGGGNVINVPGNPTGTNGDGISTNYDSGTIIQGNFIGTNAAGTDMLLVYNGIRLRSTDLTATGAQIGGTDPGTGNVIASAVNAGIFIDIRATSSTSAPTIQGNFIGTDKTGSYELPNKWGVWDVGGVKLIGGTTAGARNVISGNEIGIVEAANLNPPFPAIKGNSIGPTSNGLPLGNTQIGIKAYNGGVAVIGGTEAGAGNTIAFNGSASVTGYGGVVILDNYHCSVLSNSIFSNGGLGIDLGGDGVTANDSEDLDLGPNNQQNFPSITSAITAGAITTVDGTLNSFPSTSYSLQFFSNPTCDPSGHGQGKTLVGSTTVTTNGGGDGTFHTALSGVAPAGQFLTATATDPNNNTSEFSACVLVAAGAPTPTDTPTKTPTPTQTPTPTRTPTLATPTATKMPTVTATPLRSVEPVSLTLDDIVPSFSSNANSVFDLGETVNVDPSWKNTSPSVPVPLQGTASSLETEYWGAPSRGAPPITYAIVMPAADYGTIPAGGTQKCQTCYSMSATFDIPDTLRPLWGHIDAKFTETPSTGDAPQVWVIHLGMTFSDVSPAPIPPHRPVSGPSRPATANPFYAKIEALVHNKITTGCTATTYCPSDPVTRGAMAIFIAKVMAGGGANVPVSGTANGKPYNCAAGGVSAFTDVAPTDSFCKHAHYLAVQNVTLGCSATKFCPGDDVNREAMAGFLARALVAPAGGPGIPSTYSDPVTSLAYSCDAASMNIHFTDVPVTDGFCKHVHYLWAKGIVGGCGATTYCPTDTVARDAMAKFLVNAFGLKLYGP